MRETRPSGSEGGEALHCSFPTPIISSAFSSRCGWSRGASNGETPISTSRRYLGEKRLDFVNYL